MDRTVIEVGDGERLSAQADEVPGDGGGDQQPIAALQTNAAGGQPRGAAGHRQDQPLPLLPELPLLAPPGGGREQIAVTLPGVVPAGAGLCTDRVPLLPDPLLAELPLLTAPLLPELPLLAPPGGGPAGTTVTA